MKKTLIALAALAATASFAQVSITGRVALGVSSYSATGATPLANLPANFQTTAAQGDAAARTKVDEYSSRLKFAVNEDLGGGMRAFGVYEFGLNFDTGSGNGQAGTANAAAAFNGSRESHIGLGNGLMEVRIGRQNVYWTQGDLSEQGANFVGKDSIADLYTRQANVRQNNAILLNLNATSFAGSQVYWAPEVASESTPVGTPAAGKSDSNASTWGAKLNWDQDKIHVMVDYQKRNNIAADAAGTFPTTASVLTIPGTAGTSGVFDATSLKIGVGYRYAERSIVALHYFDMKKEYADAASNSAAISSVAGGNKQTGWAAVLTHNLGSGYLGYASYGVLNTQNGTAGNADLADSGATVWSLGLRKELSKRTAVFANYGQVNNAANSNYAPTGGSFTPVTAAYGSRPTYGGVGIMHNF